MAIENKNETAEKEDQVKVEKAAPEEYDEEKSKEPAILELQQIASAPGELK